MRRRVKFVLSAACGTLATLLALGHADAVRAQAESERSEMLERYGGEVTSLVVAREGLSQGDVVSESDVEVREWLAALAPEGAMTGLDDVVGKRLTSAVASGSPLSEVDFAGGAGALQVPEGRVAVTVRLSEKTGVAADIAAGTRLLAYGVEDGVPQLISSDALVLGREGEHGETGAASSSRELTVAVAPEAVMQVLAASASGGLRLVVPAEDIEGEGAQAVLSDAEAAVDGEAPSSVPAETGAAGDAVDVPATDATQGAVPVEEPAPEAVTSDSAVTAGGGPVAGAGGGTVAGTSGDPAAEVSAQGGGA